MATRQMGLFHRASKQLVVSDLLQVCDVTGKRVLPTYLAHYRRSGKRAIKELFSRSDLSGEEGIAKLLQKCQVTGRKLFPDEMVTLSDGRRVGQDRAFSCHGCGANVDVQETFRCDSCHQVFCLEDGNGSTCNFCNSLLLKREGQPLNKALIQSLRKQTPWIHSAMHIPAHDLVFVEGRGPFWRLGK